MVKMPTVFVAAIMLCAQPAAAWDHVVKEGALFCNSPTSQKEAFKAMTERDQNWLISLGCGILPMNTIATLIESPPPVLFGRMSKVRLNELNVTVWMNNIDIIRIYKNKDPNYVISGNNLRRVQEFIRDNTRGSLIPSTNLGDVTFAATLVAIGKNISIYITGVEYREDIQNNASIMSALFSARHIFWPMKSINDAGLSNYIKNSGSPAPIVDIPMEIAR